jgi:hypothetical protein
MSSQASTQHQVRVPQYIASNNLQLTPNGFQKNNHLSNI